MQKNLIIVDKLPSFIPEQEGWAIISSKDYINDKLPSDIQKQKHIKVINLCSQYDYLKSGYYCSLLADARGHRCVPSITDIVYIQWKRIYKSSLADLNSTINKLMSPPEGAIRMTIEIPIFFGRVSRKEWEDIGRQAFDLFRFPAMILEAHFNAKEWEVKEVYPLSFSHLKTYQDQFNEALGKFTGSYWSKSGKLASKTKDKYWLAILHNPDDPCPPSDAETLQKFVEIGKRKGVFVELITRKDMDMLLEFDALFIRETTSVNSHTYRFAQKAEEEDIPSIDDTASILRCCNKVFLHELFTKHTIPAPKTYFLHRRQPNLPQGIESEFPMVLKIPDSSSSRGMHKVNSIEEIELYAKKLFAKSEVLLLQEFIRTDFDWRILVLGGEAIVACKYFMAKDHWQIVNHAQKDSAQDYEGAHLTLAIEDVPKEIVAIARKAANLIGNGFYGVDLKQTDDGIYVMEINDNPSIDSGVEDAVLGDALYEKIFDHFQKLIDA